ncbi:intracellular hyphae protein 1 [Colletotrichum orchidophilum]|uniref:Intracellular hyphae protein 1 n=1 Tax=Colletotrichum orchidophilum TaxID=1209926 RepID=A0A1G4BH59_9PEZI|nr:intracellular hyphae protein 1 [Colletotrichum orchidophilum]OHF00734.1 intracellular hyphae protein 1 [Colletotrichum orchidophilum]
MRSSTLYLALAGLASIVQANPISQPDAQTDPRGIITRGLSHLLSSRSEPTRSGPPPTRRQATTPPPPVPSNPGCSIPPGGAGIPNASRNITLTVIGGDTLGQIARLLNSGICNIAKLNNIANPDFILISQVLQVPINIANPDNESCLNRGGANPPPANPPANPPPAMQNSTAPGKATKVRRSGDHVF